MKNNVKAQENASTARRPSSRAPALASNAA